MGIIHGPPIFYNEMRAKLKINPDSAVKLLFSLPPLERRLHNWNERRANGLTEVGDGYFVDYSRNPPVEVLDLRRIIMRDVEAALVLAGVFDICNVHDQSNPRLPALYLYRRDMVPAGARIHDVFVEIGVPCRK
jgi:hypothetical protein